MGTESAVHVTAEFRPARPRRRSTSHQNRISPLIWFITTATKGERRIAFPDSPKSRCSANLGFAPALALERQKASEAGSDLIAPLSWKRALYNRFRNSIEKHAATDLGVALMHPSDYSICVPHDLQDLFDLVKDRTGYPVSVASLEEQSSHVSMRSASRGTPVHAIFPNPRYERFANYLVATQCLMILLKWADPEGVFDLVVDDQKADALKRKIMGGLAGGGLTDSATMQYAQSLVSGLLLQLQSAPLEMLSVESCFRDYPRWRAEQRSYVTAYLREISSTLAPDIRKATPPDVYDRVVKMNAAYTLGWAEISGEAGGLLPYEALGFAKAGRDLLNDLKSIPSGTPDIYRRSVDAWAVRLGLGGWYHWSPRDI